MIFTPTKIDGVVMVSLQPHIDERGSFARSWCAEEFAQQGLDARLTQCNISISKYRGTLRGLHFQKAPNEEAKLVRVTCGAVFDVAVDLRSASDTFGQWISAELTAANHRALYVPPGCAHGLQVLSDDTEVFYQMSSPYVATAARGIRWDDPDLAIAWPLAVTTLSQSDRQLPTLAQAVSDLAVSDLAASDSSPADIPMGQES